MISLKIIGRTTREISFYKFLNPILSIYFWQTRNHRADPGKKKFVNTCFFGKNGYNKRAVEGQRW